MLGWLLGRQSLFHLPSEARGVPFVWRIKAPEDPDVRVCLPGGADGNQPAAILRLFGVYREQHAVHGPMRQRGLE